VPRRLHRTALCLTLLASAAVLGGCASQLSQTRADNERLSQTVAELRADKRRNERRLRALEDDQLRASTRGAEPSHHTTTGPAAAGAAPDLPVEVLGPADPAAGDSDLGQLDPAQDDDEGSWAGGGPVISADDQDLEPELELDTPTPTPTPAPVRAPRAAARRVHAGAAHAPTASATGTERVLARAPVPAIPLRRPDGATRRPDAAVRTGTPALAIPSRREQPVAEAGDARASYQRAVAALRAGQHDDAALALRAFVQRYPGHDLADNAQYWLGEAFYDRKDFTRALAEFRATVDRFPGGNKVPDAMLKMGYCYLAMGQDDKARFTLQQVVAIYPGGEPALLAQQRLEHIGR
jgi:tol-pal system protein YbgF